MSYTIGTALVDARDNQLQSDLLVEGQWLHGVVTAVDGFGVVLERKDGSHSVVRIESIAAVEVNAPDTVGSRSIPRQMAVAR
jgi:sRNA-binding regulator protein Hfq